MIGQNTETQNQDSVNVNPTNLETENSETANANPPNPEQENVETQNLDSTNPEQQNPKSSFPVLPFTITSSVILVLGIAVAVVLAKRRKGKAAK